MKLDFEHVVNRSAAAYFAVIADPRRRGEWNASVRSIEMLTDGPPGVGTRWCERTWGLGSFTIEIVEFVPERRFAEVALDDRSDLWLTLELTAIGRGHTLVHVTAGGGMGGWRRLPQALLQPVMPALVRADLNRAATR